MGARQASTSGFTMIHALTAGHSTSHRRYCCLKVATILAVSLLQSRHAEASFFPVLKTPLSSSLLQRLPLSSLSTSPRGSSSSLSSSSKVSRTPKQEKPSTDVSSYYLLWSPKFLPKLIGSALLLTAYLLSVRRMISTGYMLYTPPKTVPLGRLSNNFILPMLSSSCCLLQLIMNVLLVGGCAGFNTYLGPARPYFLALLGYFTILSPATISLKFAMMILLRFILAMLPELVHFWNETRPSSTYSKSSSSPSPSSSPSFPPDLGSIRASIHLTIPTMGCVACINKIDSSLRAPQQVVDAKSWLSDDDNNGGKANVLVAVNSLDELNDIRQIIVEAVHRAGFGKDCEIESMEVAAGLDEES